jgi:hypothetical protein
MERERVETIVAELNSLFEQQLKVLKTVNLNQLTPDQIMAYDERYRRIRELCQKLGAEETLAVGAGV